MISSPAQTVYFLRQGSQSNCQLWEHQQLSLRFRRFNLPAQSASNFQKSKEAAHSVSGMTALGL